MATKRQIGSSGKRQLASDGKQLIADECCCGPGCSTRCYVEFSTTWDCVSDWATPVETDRFCTSPTNIGSLGWTVDPDDCLSANIIVSSGVCCTNDASCGTVSVSTPATRPSAVACFTTAPPADCTDCCDIDVTILSGCSAGTYRVPIRGHIPCGGFKDMADVDPSLGGRVTIRPGNVAGCVGKWELDILTVDTTDTVDPTTGTCFHQTCHFYYCSPHPDSCYCPPEGSWPADAADKNCLGPDDPPNPGIMLTWAC